MDHLKLKGNEEFKQKSKKKIFIFWWFWVWRNYFKKILGVEHLKKSFTDVDVKNSM